MNDDFKRIRDRAYKDIIPSSEDPWLRFEREYPTLNKYSCLKSHSVKISP